MKQTVNWHSYWDNKTPGFHEGQVNSYLKKYLPLFNIAPGDSIFMPLCGKAIDILWLAEQGYHVIGVELSQVAVESFFEESNLVPELRADNNLKVYQSGHITLYQGDYLDLEPRHLTACKLVYDRAAIVAIESFNRVAYVERMFHLIPDKTPILLVTLDYDQAQMMGPPFSVPEDEIRSLYQSRYDIELLESIEQIHERPKWREKGLQSLMESALRMTSK